MNFQEKLNEIKRLVFGDQAPVPAPEPTPAPAPVPMAAVDYKLKDGTVVSIDTLAVGGIVTLNGDPATDAEYQLEDGTIVQTKGGVIVELSSPVEDTIPEEMKQLPTQMAAMKQSFASQSSVIAALESKVEAQDKALKLMFELVEKFGETPVVEPKETINPNKLSNYQKLLKARGEL
jgi:hypothetical protein